MLLAKLLKEKRDASWHTERLLLLEVIRDHGPQLGNSNLNGRLLGPNALLIENAHLTAGFLWQEHHRRKLPFHADGLDRTGQIGDVNDPSISTRLRFRTWNTARIHALARPSLPVEYLPARLSPRPLAAGWH